MYCLFNTKIMKKIRTFPVIAILIILIISCIDRDILNISDSLEIHSSYSVPVGAFKYDINNYLESLDTVTLPWPDSLVYNDILFPTFSSSVSFTSTDTISFNLIKDPLAMIRSIEFLILVDNGYPTEISAQIYFLSAGSALPVDSVFKSGPCVVPPAEVNDEGKVTRPFTSLFNVFMTDEFLQKLPEISWIMIRGRVNTTKPDVRWVKFYSDYQIDLHIGSRIELLYNTGDL